MKEETEIGVRITGSSIGKCSLQNVSNIILGKIKPYIEKNTGEYQNRFRGGRSVIDNIFALKIIN
jgi:hypothetical protein